VIIDEVLAQILTLCLTTPFAASFAYGKDPWMFCAIVLLGPFLFFRFFDIVKPWPVSWVDKNIKNAFGVMFDDVVGAILAAICYNALFIIFL